MVSISEKLNLKPQLSGADIKSLYEAEADTNVYTNAEKTFVSTALQPAALNNTALTGIPTAPTAAEGTNTEQIATTAFVLANSEIDNGIVINGVANFWQSTPPTQRVDGSALIDGDIWHQTGVEDWIRRGIYWVSNTTYNCSFHSQANITASTTFNSVEGILSGFVIFVEKVIVYFKRNTDPDFDSSNYWNVSTAISRNYVGGILLLPTGFISYNTSTPLGNVPGCYMELNQNINGVFTYSPSEITRFVGFSVAFSKVGSPGSLGGFKGNWIYRKVYT